MPAMIYGSGDRVSSWARTRNIYRAITRLDTKAVE